MLGAMLIVFAQGCHGGTSLHADGIPEVSELQSAIWVRTSPAQSESYEIVVTRFIDACTRYQSFVERCTALLAEFSSPQTCEDPIILERFAELHDEFTATEGLSLHVRATELVPDPDGGPSTFSADWFHDVGNSFSCALNRSDGENPFRAAQRVWDPEACRPDAAIDDGRSALYSFGEGRLTIERMGGETLHGTLAATLYEAERKNPRVLSGSFDANSCDLGVQDSGADLCIHLALGSPVLLYAHPTTLDRPTE